MTNLIGSKMLGKIQKVLQSLESLADLREAVYCLLSRCVFVSAVLLTEQKPISVTKQQDMGVAGHLGAAFRAGETSPFFFAMSSTLCFCLFPVFVGAEWPQTGSRWMISKVSMQGGFVQPGRSKRGLRQGRQLPPGLRSKGVLL